MSDQETPTVPLGALLKRKRTGIEKRLACSLKPASLADVDSVGEDGEVVSNVTYVDDGTRNEIVMPCTREVFRKVTGDPKPGKRFVKSLDQKLNTHFLIAVEKVQGQDIATGIDILPEITPNKFNMVSEEQQAVDTVTVVVNQSTGELEVKSVPPGLTKRALLFILSALDREEALYPGQRLGGRYDVVGVSGNTVSIDPGGQ